VNARYVIATSTKIDVSSVDVEKFDNKYFAKEKEAKKTGEEEFFKDGEKEVCASTVAYIHMCGKCMGY